MQMQRKVIRDWRFQPGECPWWPSPCLRVDLCLKLCCPGRFCIDAVVGACWTRVVAGQCEASLPGAGLRAECCCSLGRAWGSPCQECSGTSHTHQHNTSPFGVNHCLFFVKRIFYESLLNSQLSPMFPLLPVKRTSVPI